VFDPKPDTRWSFIDKNETECAGTVGSDFWTDLKWYMDNMLVIQIGLRSRTDLAA
jgi:hypothetical protein